MEWAAENVGSSLKTGVFVPELIALAGDPGSRGLFVLVGFVLDDCAGEAVAGGDRGNWCILLGSRWKQAITGGNRKGYCQASTIGLQLVLRDSRHG